jgi:hypothetical protein
MADRRIVVCHTNGMRRIIGIIAGTVAPSNLPKELSGMLGPEMMNTALGAVEKRYVVYREYTPKTEADGA